MKSNASAPPLPFVHEDIKFQDEGGKEFVMVSLPKIKHDGPGHPDDRGMMTTLRTAVLAESRLAIEALCGLDVRGLLPDKYETATLKGPDKRSGEQRREDAEDLIEAEHKFARQYFESLCGLRVGYSISEIKKRGQEAVQKHYGKDKLQNLNEFMRKENRPYALDALPGETDEKLATTRLEIITALLTAWAKWEETLSFHKDAKRLLKRKKRGRPSKNEDLQHDIIPAVPRYSSKIDFDDGDQSCFIADHSGINPALLWTNLAQARELLEFHVIFGKYHRGILWNTEEISFFEKYVVPFMLGRQLPQTWQELAICRRIGWLLDKWENTAQRLGQTSMFSNPILVEYFRRGANFVYNNGVLAIDLSDCTAAHQT